MYEFKCFLQYLIQVTFIFKMIIYFFMNDQAKCGTEDFKLFKGYEDEKRDNSFEDCKDYQQCNHGYHSLPNAILLLISTLLVVFNIVFN